jgi:Antitoxin of toxin-antitoxin, RelE / RelB, TA system
MTEARRHLPALLDKARNGEWQLIGRRGRSEAVLANVAELDELLCTVYRFRPEVDLAEQGVGIWLPELETHGVGATLDEALADLADAMVEYAEDWVDHLRHAVNHRPRAGYVRRIQLAGDVAGVLARLGRDADAVSEAGGAETR